MIDGAIRLLAIVLSLIVMAGFAMFAVEELGGASERQQSEVEDPGTSRDYAPAPKQERTGIAGAIEDAYGALLKPFPVSSSNAWVANGIPTLLALALYGVGLGYLARWVRSRT